MGLSSSMWASVSGLQAHGDRMNVVSNNISNMNTVGFKGSRMDFADFMSQSYGTVGGLGQVGRGVRAGIIMGDFSQGAFEVTNNSTDVAIQGNGYFSVRASNTNNTYYTRSGNFQWNNDGSLVDAHGYPVQGWKVDNETRNQGGTTGTTSSTSSSIVGSGVPTDITLDSFTVAPKHTSNISLALNLDSSTGNDRTVDEDNPFFSLLNAWDATPDVNGNVVGLGKNAYAYPYTMDVFDEGGQAHKITIYFDRVTQTADTNIDNLKNNTIQWEYIVTMDPSEDIRDFGNGTIDDKYKGLLMSGTISFDTSGQMKDMTAYVPTSDDLGDLNTWKKAPISSNGYPLFNANFSGAEGASSAWDSTGTKVNPEADGRLIEANFGLRSTSNSWGGSAPDTIADWTQFTGNQKSYKSDKAEGTLVEVEDSQGITVYGVVGNDKKVYTPRLVTGEDDGVNIPVAEHVTTGTKKQGTTDYVVYKQRNKADGYSAGKGEAVDSDGWIYKQLTTSIVGPAGGTASDFPVVQDSAGSQFAYDASTQKYQQISPSASGVWTDAPSSSVTNVPDTTKKIASDTAIADTANPRYKYDSDGNTIAETVTHVYTGMGTAIEHEDPSFTSYSGAFSEKHKSQDGYTFGELQSTDIDEHGVITGHYSNGITSQLYQITLYDFPSSQGLRREGGNLFSETQESGLATSGAAGSGVFGTTSSHSLEQSNVDLSTQFVNMITTQRGYQANSKAITTVDTMLETVIGMKR